MVFKLVLRWDPRWPKLRLFRLMWNVGTVGDGKGYSRKIAVALRAGPVPLAPRLRRHARRATGHRDPLTNLLGREVCLMGYREDRPETLQPLAPGYRPTEEAAIQPLSALEAENMRLRRLAQSRYELLRECQAEFKALGCKGLVETIEAALRMR